MLLYYTIIISVLAITHSAPIDEYFPFGTAAGDTLFPPNDDESTGALPLPIDFPFFDHIHQQIYLSNNGLFSFLQPIVEFVPDPFPLNDSRRLIAGFWSDIDTREKIANGNQVFYQIYVNSSVNSMVVFGKAVSYVQRFFPIEKPFNPSMVVTGTWHRVGAYSKQINRLNSFQIVLATDALRSFAFLLYNDIQWATPGTSSSSIGGQAGFNAGDGIIFQMLPYSRTNNIVQLPVESNVNVPGVFAFRVDTDIIEIGGCSNISIPTLWPRRGSQLGSTVIIVQGPCFTNLNAGDVKCRFGSSKEVDAVIIDDFKAICLTPVYDSEGPTYVELSTDSGRNYRKFQNTFLYTPLHTSKAFSEDTEVSVGNLVSTVLSTGDNVTLSWSLSTNTRSLWGNRTVEVEIQFLTVMLGLDDSILRLSAPILVGQQMVRRNILQTFSLIIPYTNTVHPAGFFRVIVRDNRTSTIYSSLSSSVFPLNTIVQNARNNCDAWVSREPQPATWNEDLDLCPMTLRQARAAFCCYESDLLCVENSNNPTLNCEFYRGRVTLQEESAIACFNSRISNWWKAGTKCCYNSNGMLITRGLGAGHDQQKQPISFITFNFFNDFLPYISCCLLSLDSGLCDTYFSLRPPRAGGNTPSTSGATWGDPYFKTLDGTSYVFNGYGEYTYLAVATSSSPTNSFNPLTQNYSFISQIRTTPICLSDGTTISTATVIRGFAAKSNHSKAEPISVTISNRQLPIILRGREVIDFDSGPIDVVTSSNLIALSYPELTIQKNRTDGMITLAWAIGITIRIVPVILTLFANDVLVFNLGISVADDFRSRTYGLLGSYDANKTNDFRIPNGTVVGIPENMTIEQIHRGFGQTWAIDPAQSLFYYATSGSSTFYSMQDQMFIPSFILPQPALSRLSQIQAACGIISMNQSSWSIGQYSCFYDISITDNIDFGIRSLSTGNQADQISMDERCPPIFNADIPSIITIPSSISLYLNFTAISPYTSSIFYSLLAAPNGSSLNNETATFTWHVPSISNVDIIVSVRAQDSQYDLTSTINVLVRVRNIVTNTVLSSTTPVNSNVSNSTSASPGASSTISANPGASSTISANPGASISTSANPGASSTISASPGASISTSVNPSISSSTSTNPRISSSIYASSSVSSSSSTNAGVSNGMPPNMRASSDRFTSVVTMLFAVVIFLAANFAHY